MSTVHAPEVTSDQPFYQLIKGLASLPCNLNLLEIGSSTGLGSTQAFIEGISTREDRSNINLYCLEMFQPAFAELLLNTRSHNYIKCINANSIAINELPAWNDIVHFYRTRKTFLNNYTLETVKQWYDTGVNYATQTGLTNNGIREIKLDFKLSNFDLVLIDGSEFTGEQDLYSVMGSKTIILDDCLTYKCYQAYQVLSHHSSYSLMVANMENRHGYAVFQRLY